MLLLSKMEDDMNNKMNLCVCFVIFFSLLVLNGCDVFNPITEPELRCKTCRGWKTIECSNCDGTHYVDCEDCSDGTCGDCDKDNEVECKKCETGRITCPTCKGTGKK